MDKFLEINNQTDNQSDNSDFDIIELINETNEIDAGIFCSF